MRPEIDMGKLSNLATANELLDAKYGRKGSSSRDVFDAKAKAWYYAEVLKIYRYDSTGTGRQNRQETGVYCFT